MIKNRLAKWVFGSTFVLTMLVPVIAFAQEAAAAAAPDELAGDGRQGYGGWSCDGSLGARRRLCPGQDRFRRCRHARRAS